MVKGFDGILRAFPTKLLAIDFNHGFGEGNSYGVQEVIFMDNEEKRIPSSSKPPIPSLKEQNIYEEIEIDSKYNFLSLDRKPTLRLKKNKL